MSGDLDPLWALRDLDERAYVLRVELRRFPEQRAALERAMTEQKTRLERYKNDSGALQLKRRETEREIESLSAQARKFRGQLAAVKKNEEYTALLHEIEGVKRKRSDLETEVLMAFESEERLSGERAQAERALQAAQREAQERTQKLDAEERQDRERLEAIDAQRAGHIAQLPPATRARYERIHQSREGRAVVAIQKGACGGCFRGQPPQILQDARKRDRMLICEGCGRILVWPPDAP